MAQEQTYTLLYVDDEMDNLAAFRALFRRQYQVLTAGSAAEARQQLADHSVDLIITDNRMPHETGIELLEYVRVVYPAIVRMLVTGYVDMETALQAINQGGVDQFLLKPWSIDELKSILANALETVRLRRENERLLEEKRAWLLEQAALEKLSVTARFNLLKHQLNPHFLFNSFNVLTSLIAIDPNQAVRYTQQFSQLFRLLLTLNDQPVIPLREELEFVTTWLGLQQVRFGQNLQVQIHVEPNDRDRCLPPMALHTLVENAVKHNEISSRFPLSIYIERTEQGIEVRNSLQLRKSSAELSTGLGLANLRERYALLGGLCILEAHTDQWFSITVPLINPNEVI